MRQLANDYRGGSAECDHDWRPDLKIWHTERGNGPRKEIFDDSFQTNGRESGFCLKCHAWRGELGLEPYFFRYVDHLCLIFDEARRVLKPTGTLWVNLGDTYNSHAATSKNVGGFQGRQMKNNQAYADSIIVRKKVGVPDKSLCQIPNRFAIAMIDRGWILWNELIWWKPNCMPSSVKDRFTVDFEKIFFFTKSKKFYFAPQREGKSVSRIFNIRVRDVKHARIKHLDRRASVREVENYQEGYREITGRNKRAVWRIAARPFPEAHFAVYPPELLETPIKAGCPESGIVLDPFMGAGTTALVALQLNRSFIGIELNPEYIRIAEKRLAGWNTKSREHQKRKRPG